MALTDHQALDKVLPAWRELIAPYVEHDPFCPCSLCEQVRASSPVAAPAAHTTASYAPTGDEVTCPQCGITYSRRRIADENPPIPRWAWPDDSWCVDGDLELHPGDSCPCGEWDLPDTEDHYHDYCATEAAHLAGEQN
jgi:hypothetical protein